MEAFMFGVLECWSPCWGRNEERDGGFVELRGEEVSELAWWRLG